MNNKGQVIFHLQGKVGATPLSPDNYDVIIMRRVLNNAIALLNLDGSNENQPTTLKISDGSVKNIFYTPVQKTAEFTAVLMMVAGSYSLDQLEPKTAEAFEDLQDLSRKSGIEMMISTSESKGHTLSITPLTQYQRTAAVFADAEMYLYGKIISCGGKSKGTIKLDTGNTSYTIEADKEIIAGWKDNHLYREYGVRVNCRQNVYTGEIEQGTIKLIEILDYSRMADEAYMEEKIRRATPHWEGVDADEFIKEIREDMYV